MKLRLFILFLLGLMMIQCKHEANHTHHDHPPEEYKAVEVIPIPPDSTTQVMIDRYQKCIASLDPVGISSYISSKILEGLDSRIAAATGAEKLELQVQKANALLNVGKTAQSIALIKNILEAMANSDSDRAKRINYYLQKQLAVAYMRKGEQDNCLNNHNDESCIIPISKKAQHQLREGSEKTIEILEQLIREDGSDKETQYLLNVAHMTLGNYPEKVPAAYRIPPEYFESKVDFPKFKDIATGLGVGVSELSGGTCIDDFNNDGYLDIIASSWGFQDQIRYFENDKHGGFIDMTDATGLKGVCGGLNLRHADFNNDGHLDFIILRGAWLDVHGKLPNSLIQNNGDGTFTDVTIEAGLYSLFPTQTAVWADFNLDGWLDLFIANESTPEAIHKNELYINQKDGKFVNMIENSGLDVAAYFKGVAVGDVNNDRYPDIYLSNFLGKNVLFMNDGNQDEVHFSLPTIVTDLANPKFSFSTWMFDYNNDGRDDIFVSGYSNFEKSPAALMMDYTRKKEHEHRPYLFKNLGKGRFAEVSLRAGLDEPVTTMGCNFGDLNNDGYLDFYLASGNPNYYSIVPNKMYLNNEGKSFEDVTYASGFGHIQKGHAVGFGDFDMDGDQDIYTVMGGAYEGDVYSNLLFENPIGNDNNWIHIKLIGKQSNTSAIGSKIILTITENGKKRKIYHNVGYDASFGGNSLLAELGVGKAKRIDQIEVLWANAEQSTSQFADVAANQNIIIEEGRTQFEKAERATTPFRVTQGHHHHHH